MPPQRRPDNTPVKEDDCLLTQRDVAYMLGLGPCSVIRLVNRGEFLTPIMFGTSPRWRYGDVKRFVRLLGATRPRPAAEVPTILPADMAGVEDKLSEYVTDWIKPCVYFLLRKDEVVYVGQTKCLPVRVEQHRKGDATTEPKVFDRVMFLCVDETRLGWVERQYILRLKPFYNVSGNSQAR